MYRLTYEDRKPDNVLEQFWNTSPSRDFILCKGSNIKYKTNVYLHEGSWHNRICSFKNNTNSKDADKLCILIHLIEGNPELAYWLWFIAFYDKDLLTYKDTETILDLVVGTTGADILTYSRQDISRIFDFLVYVVGTRYIFVNVIKETRETGTKSYCFGMGGNTVSYENIEHINKEYYHTSLCYNYTYGNEWFDNFVFDTVVLGVDKIEDITDVASVLDLFRKHHSNLGNCGKYEVHMFFNGERVYNELMYRLLNEYKKKVIKQYRCK